MNALTFVLGSICLIELLFNRLSQASWKTVKLRYMLVYVGSMSVHFYVIYRSCTEGVSWAGLVFVAYNVLWLFNTRGDWKVGIPPHMRSDYGDLGPAETRP